MIDSVVVIEGGDLLRIPSVKCVDPALHDASASAPPGATVPRQSALDPPDVRDAGIIGWKIGRIASNRGAPAGAGAGAKLTEMQWPPGHC